MNFNVTFPGGYVCVEVETSDDVVRADRQKLYAKADALSKSCKAALAPLVSRRKGCTDHALNKTFTPTCSAGTATIKITGEITAVKLDQSQVDKIIVWS
ncbi:MAG TPA: hypothetical protein VFZ48_05260 [Candidatus Saccharimonadales bacterium]